MKITINGAEIALKFDYGTFRIMAKNMGLRGVQDVFNVFGDLEGRELDIMAELLLAAANSAGNDTIDIDNVGNWIMQNTNRMTEITCMLQESLPKPQAAGNAIKPKAKKPSANQPN